MVSVGSEVVHVEPDPDAPLFEQYQAGSAAYWVAMYCHRKLDAAKVSATDQQTTGGATNSVLTQRVVSMSRHGYILSMQKLLEGSSNIGSSQAMPQEVSLPMPAS